MFNAPHGADMEKQRITAKNDAALASFVPLHVETRAAVDTATAAHHLNRQPQTLRGWACLEHGPIRPVRVHGRLAWKVADIRRLLEVAK